MPHDCHSREGGNPEKHWMPDQVRHDEQGTLCALAYERVSMTYYYCHFSRTLSGSGIFLCRNALRSIRRRILYEPVAEQVGMTEKEE